MTKVRHMLLFKTLIVLKLGFPKQNCWHKNPTEYMLICSFSIKTHKFMVCTGFCRISRGTVVSGKALPSICIKLLLVWIFSLTGIAVLTADKVHPVESGIRRTLLQNKLKQLSWSLFRPQRIISVSTNGIASFQWKNKRKDKAV